MNQILDLNVDNLRVNPLYVNGCLTSSGATSISSSYSNDIVLAGNVYFGSHSFKAEQLGQLFNLLISQHPELHL